MKRNPDTQIYGLVGYRGVGKDTLAKKVVDASPSFTVLHFADPLRELCGAVFGIAIHTFLDRELKEAQIPPINIDDHLLDLSKRTGLPLKKLGLVAETPRQLLQFVGTDYVRSACDSYWIDRTLDEVRRLKQKVLVADTRFPNEIAALRSVGAKIIRLRRSDIAATGTHTSDVSLSELEPDLDVFLKADDMRLTDSLATTIASGYFRRSAYQYDYRLLTKIFSLYEKGLGFSDIGKELGLRDLEKKGARGIVRNLFDYYGVPVRGAGVSTRKAHVFVDGQGESKECSKCKGVLALQHFNKSIRSWDGFLHLCRECQASYNKEKYASSSWSVPLIFSRAQKSAKYRGIEFSLTLEYAVSLWETQGGLCHYLKQPLSFTNGDALLATLDRISSDSGYVPGNVVWCAYRVNIMKRNDSLEEFGKWVALLAGQLPFRGGPWQ